MFFQLFRNRVFQGTPKRAGYKPQRPPPLSGTGCPRHLPCSGAEKRGRIVYLVAASLHGGDSKCYYLCLAQAGSS